MLMCIILLLRVHNTRLDLHWCDSHKAASLCISTSFYGWEDLWEDKCVVDRSSLYGFWLLIRKSWAY